MDSSNSGSFQSSSGGAAGGGGGGGGDNEEYDSRTHNPISSFLNPSTHFNPNHHHHHLRPPPPPPSHHHHPPTADQTPLFDPYFSHPNRNPNPNPLHSFDSPWTGNVRPDPNPNMAEFGSTRTQTTFDNYPINPNSSSSRMDANTKTGRGSDHNQIGVTIKNPKKRTRASRRAPTTVLTTDTTNFRQMVQEFTGIPAAPFTDSPFSRRLDLFGRSGDGGTASFYPLRPSAQKIQHHQPSFLNSMANIVESGTSNNITNATTSSNYDLPPSEIHDFQKQPSTLLDLQNPMLSFQSLLQTTLAQQSNNLSGFPSASKRWRGEDGKVDSFEGVISNTQNIGGSKVNSGLENVVVSSRSGGDQVQGNEDSWICPSN